VVANEEAASHWAQRSLSSQQPTTLRHSSFEASDGVGLLTLRRPEVRNALSGVEMIRELADTLEPLSSRTLGALVVTGEGSAFSAGGNVKDMVAREGLFAPASEPDLIDAYRTGVQRLLQLLYRCEMVTFAAVNGPAVGAGLDLALACDLCYCSPSATFSAPFVSIGLVPGDGGLPLLVEAVGRQRAAELLFTPRRWNADEALRFGLVLEIVPSDQLLDHVLGLANKVASQPRQALAFTKQLLRVYFGDLDRRVSELSAAFQAIAQSGEEHRRAVEGLSRD